MKVQAKKSKTKNTSAVATRVTMHSDVSGFSLLNHVFSIDLTAKALGCSPSTVRRAIDARELGHVTIGRRVGVTKRQIDEFLSKQEVKAIDANALTRQILG